jgi:hypothetical protein
MKPNEFDTTLEIIKSIDKKINRLISDKNLLENELREYEQFHRPKISISIFKGKYYHSTCRIYLDDGKVLYHTAHLGKKDLFVDKNDERLLRLSESKMREVLIAKYPDMFK